MNHGQSKRLGELYPKFDDGGGKLIVDGVPAANAAEAAIALSCLNDIAMEQFLSDLADAQLILECLDNPLILKPDYVPSRDSKPTFYVTCSSGGHSHAYSKWE